MISKPQLARLSAVVVVSLSTALAACSAPAPMASDAPIVAALIVKPKIVTSDPAAVLKPMRATLGKAAGTQYVRQLAGDAHIVYLTSPATSADVAQLVERLRASGAFQYVELDTMMKIK